jgi:hypothetical protein
MVLAYIRNGPDLTLSKLLWLLNSKSHSYINMPVEDAGEQ